MKSAFLGRYASRAAAVLLLLAANLVPPAAAAGVERWEDRPALERHFQAAGVRGTIVVMDEASGRWIASDSRRAHARYLPASTFKIPNTLIALETGVAADAAQPWRWDGVQREFPDWNRDQTLESAFKVSAVWVYQDIARKVGAERMAAFVRDFRYGNAETGPVLERFWLDGGLRISAVEQVDFLRRFLAGSLPLSERSQRLGRELMLREETPAYRLYAKTGWTGGGRDSLGWYVGWVERGTQRSYFALNIDMPDGIAQAPLRERLVRTVLGELGLMQ
ncbi:class D beta-lactamase [Azoarcus indigens]|uniref:Beta-lactamase n=1 Tax=Azoarcus indigens TaxID=29545 RepID=A0A4R6DUT6_9RHOO|nr:class D beta-lactamase [Azoarcus indigens]NMG65022.1 class D beta-lactamase [Azoarcus indigens]TDN48917.1 beta-lactamase class D [Azoarcus indigens]